MSRALVAATFLLWENRRVFFSNHIETNISIDFMHDTDRDSESPPAMGMKMATIQRSQGNAFLMNQLE